MSEKQPIPPFESMDKVLVDEIATTAIASQADLWGNYWTASFTSVPIYDASLGRHIYHAFVRVQWVNKTTGETGGFSMPGGVWQQMSENLFPHSHRLPDREPLVDSAILLAEDQFRTTSGSFFTKEQKAVATLGALSMIAVLQAEEVGVWAWPAK